MFRQLVRNGHGHAKQLNIPSRIVDETVFRNLEFQPRSIILNRVQTAQYHQQQPLSQYQAQLLGRLLLPQLAPPTICQPQRQFHAAGSKIRYLNFRHRSQMKPELIRTRQKSDKPVKFTTSEAHIDYKATHNFYHDDQSLPRSHNLVLALSGISGLFYLIFLRDDIDQDGGLALLKPIHETVPEFAIPMLQAAIVENRKFGYNTTKLEKKLAEYMKEPDKYGGEGHKLIEN